MRRARVLVSIVAFTAFGAAAATGWLLATRQQTAPPPGDVREVIVSYLADEDAATEKYRDALVTATGVVDWSARVDEITTRRADKVLERSDQAGVSITVDDCHQVLAIFARENQREALALGNGDRVTIRGRLTWGADFRGEKVYLTLEGCEFVR